MLNSHNSSCRLLAYKILSVLFFVGKYTFLTVSDLKTSHIYIHPLGKQSDFGFLSSPKYKHRPVPLCGSATPKTARLAIPLLSWQHFTCEHVCVVCMCVCASTVPLVNGRHSCYLSADVDRIDSCSNKRAQACTHTQNNQQNKGTLGRTEWHVCVH